MPRGVYTNVKCLGKATLSNQPKSNAKPHQAKVMDFFLNKSPHKGLLLYHKLGSGKTCTAIYIADTMLKTGKVSRVFIISPGSLRSTWLKEYCEICGTDLLSRYTFITYNFNVEPQLQDLDFNNSLVIIDEAHNLIKGAKNETKTYDTLLNKIAVSSCKVLALSGTPIYNHTYEWSLFGNMLKPNVFQDVFSKNMITQKEWDTVEPKLKDKMFRGIVSYFPGVEADYPAVVYEDPIEVKLKGRQADALKKMINFEIAKQRQGPPDPELLRENKEEYEQKMTTYIISTLSIQSRALSNYFPDKGNKKEVKQLLPSGEYKTTEELLPDVPFENGGWMTESMLKDPGLDVVAPKMAALIRNIIDPKHLGRKHVIFSYFNQDGGVKFLKTLFDWCNRDGILNNRTYSGDQSDETRSRILNEFNHPNNRYGGKIRVLFITEAGAEGISLKDVGHFHVLESHPVGGKIEQAIGRVARSGSHANMPDEHKNVHIWRYFGVPNGQDAFSIDKILYDHAEQNKKKLDELYKRLIDNSIENTSDIDEEHAYIPPRASVAAY